MTQIGQSGQLALKASKYKDHIDGTSDNHDGYQIILDPAISIDGYSSSNVYEAIENLNNYVGSVVVDATTTTKGVLKLSNDLGGTADSPNVIKITGDSNQLNVNPRVIAFSDTYSTDSEIKYLNKNVAAKGIKITAQGVTNGLFNILNGGNITISAGLRNSSNGTSKDGKIYLNIGNSNLMTFSQITLGTRIVSFFKDPTTSDIIGEANNTIYIGNTLANPTQVPLNGAHLYSLSGKLRAYHTNGDNFNLGDNPKNWQSGEAINGVSNKVHSQSNVGTVFTLLRFSAQSQNSTVTVEAYIVGKASASTGSVVYKLMGHFYTNGSLNFVEVGTESTLYSSTNNASGWTAPIILVSGSNILVRSGANAATAINWTAYARAVTVSN